MSRQAVPASVPPIVGRALLISTDSAVVLQLRTGMQQFAITADVCPDLATATTLINTRKFEAIVVDFALGELGVHILERVRFSPSNQNSVTFALIDSDADADSRVQPHFVIRKPLNESVVASALRASLGLIIRDYRRYFRCPLTVPLVIHINDTAQIPCETLNISEGGVAVNTGVTFKPGVRVKAQFTLPGEPSALELEAEICWCDNKGRAGMHFRSVLPPQKLLLQSWLSRKIEQSIPEPIALSLRKFNA